MLAEDHGDELGRHVLRSKKILCSRTPLRHLPRTASLGTPSSFPPPWWQRRRGSRPDPSKSWEKPTSFIEGGEEAPPPSAFGSFHRSAADSSHTTSSHREQLGLRRGQAPKSIAPISTGKNEENY